MYKKIVTLIILLIVCGCSKKDIKNNINTTIEENSNIVIGINYPITNTKLDKYINKEIEKIYNNFKEKYGNFNYLNNKSELNIDYTFTDINNYMSVALFIYIDSSKETTDYVITYFYDKKNQKLLSLKDITDDIDMLEDITDSTNLNKFTIDNDKLTLYGTNIIDIPISDLNLKININKVEKTKNVNIEIPNKVIDPTDKMVALTFDDGPSIYTEELIEYLNKEGCNATFFVLGNKVEMYADVLKKSIKYGNEIGNHSYNHKWLIKLNEESIRDQINKTQDIIKSTTGYTPKLLRPTYGSINNKIRNNTDLDIVLWNVDTLDWKYKSVKKIVSRATRNLKDGNIILMHDIHKRTIEAVKKIVPIIKEKGYTCVTISELNEVNLIREELNG